MFAQDRTTMETGYAGDGKPQEAICWDLSIGLCRRAHEMNQQFLQSKI